MIDAFTSQWNEDSSPFTWVKTADEILAKAVRKPRATNESGLLDEQAGAEVEARRADRVRCLPARTIAATTVLESVSGDVCS